MARMKQLLMLLAIFSATSSRHPNIRVPGSWLFSMEDGDSSKEINQSDNEIPDGSDDSEGQVCETRECHQIASIFAESMNTSADPCDDFYEFSCGNWIAKKNIPPYLPFWSHYMVFHNALEERIRDELQSEPTAQDILPVRQARKWFRSCMDTETREARGIKPLESLIMQNGGWPMVMDPEEWSEDDLSWQEIEENYARSTGDYSFYSIEPSRSEEDDNSEGLIKITTPNLPLSRELPIEYRNYTEDTDVYRRILQRITELFIDHSKANVPSEQLQKDIDDLMEFEQSLFQSSQGRRMESADTDEGSSTERFSLDSLIHWWNKKTKSIKEPEAKIDWRNVIQELFDSANAKVDGKVKVVILSKRYYLSLPEILRSTNKRTIVNYIHWKFVSEYLRHTTNDIQDIIFDFAKDEIGVKAQPPRWLQCVRAMKMREAAAFVFVEKYFQESTSKAAIEMMENIKEELKNQIKNSNWLSSKAREAAVQKVTEMKTLMGFPDWYKNKTAVVNYYKGLTIGSEYLDNILSFKRYEAKLRIREFQGHEDIQAGWRLDPLDLNAMYRHGLNTLNVPAADFQPPLFGHKVPDYVNYGITGVIVGHEMGHGFDEIGIKKGSNTSLPLLNEVMLKMYYQRAQCIAEYYDGLYEGRTIPPPLGQFIKASENLTSEEVGRGELSLGWYTFGENVADVTGIQSVLSAYNKMRIKKGLDRELKLPGFEGFTDEQMFFISFGGTWCEISTPQFTKMRDEGYDPHSPARLRAIGSVSNTLEFAKVFNCPRGSPMNPENKCSIWEKPGAAPKLKSSRRSGRDDWLYNRS